MFVPVNPIYTELRRGLVKYQQRWASLPQLPIPAGPTLKIGTTGERVAMLRTRLGLPEGSKYDAALAAQLQREGAEAFDKSWQDLLELIASKSAALEKIAHP